jgi:hypothetical protein
MKAKFFLILLSFLAFSGKSQAGDFLSKLLKGYYNDDENGGYSSGSDSPGDDEDDDGIHPMYTPLENTAIFVKGIYDYWYPTNKDNDESIRKNVPKAIMSADSFTMSTGAEVHGPFEEAESGLDQNVVEMKPTEAEKIEYQQYLTVEPIQDPETIEEETIPTANLITNEADIIPADKVQYVDDSITATHSRDDSKLSHLNELKEKTSKNQDQDNLNVSSFIEKANSAPLISYEEARRNHKPEPSKCYQKLVKLLQDSYMGDFNFSSVKPMKLSAKKRKNYNQMLLDGFMGMIWLDMNWADLKTKTDEYHIQIKESLKKHAKITMEYLPSLAPKTTYEKEVLEGWLISGLLAAYPTLTDGITKNDAIALIILAVLSKSFINSENHDNIIKLFRELEKYIGDLPNKFPLDQFTFNLDERERVEEEQIRLMETLIRIIREDKLPYATKVVEDIMN